MALRQRIGSEHKGWVVLPSVLPPFNDVPFLSSSSGGGRRRGDWVQLTLPISQVALIALQLRARHETARPPSPKQSGALLAAQSSKLTSKLSREVSPTAPPFTFSSALPPQPCPSSLGAPFPLLTRWKARQAHPASLSSSQPSYPHLLTHTLLPSLPSTSLPHVRSWCGFSSPVPTQHIPYLCHPPPSPSMQSRVALARSFAQFDDASGNIPMPSLVPALSQAGINSSPSALKLLLGSSFIHRRTP